MTPEYKIVEKSIRFIIALGCIDAAEILTTAEIRYWIRYFVNAGTGCEQKITAKYDTLADLQAAYDRIEEDENCKIVEAVPYVTTSIAKHSHCIATDYLTYIMLSGQLQPANLNH